MKKAIKRGEVYIDGVKGETGTWIKTGQKIELIEIDKKPAKIYQFELPIIYEDEELAVINKPAGIVVSGNQFHTVQNALLHNLTISKSVDRLQLPKSVHRLDHATSGLLLIAKTASATINLSRQFENKSIQKRYQAIVFGQLTPSKGVIEENIDNKKAITKYEVVKTIPSLKTGYLSLLNLYPKTGRTHQLRIHLETLGHSILGDKLYGKNVPLLKGKGLFLCAVELTFTHPKSEEVLNFQINPPNKFALRLAQEERRFNRRRSKSW